MTQQSVTNVAHTPGPWWYDFERDAGHGPGFTIFGPNTEAVADVTADAEGNVAGPTVEANARLIAAAPDLLKTVKALLLAIDADVTTYYPRLAAETGEARALIAKAEGRHP